MCLRRQYSSDYVAAEDAARAAKQGIWAGDFDVPADWRKERKVRFPRAAACRLCLVVEAGCVRQVGGCSASAAQLSLQLLW